MPEASAGSPNWNEAYTRAMLEHSAGVVTILDPQGVVLYSSPSVERPPGVALVEHIGTNVFHSVHPDDPGRVMEDFATRLRDPLAVFTARCRFRHADGSWRTVECTGRTVSTIRRCEVGFGG